jgi:16S rRNA (adenine1518-N6/adenine1519-N6)-dimethyltransferase
MDSSLKPTPLNIPSLLRSHGIAPNKGLGQNFLVDDSALKAIVQLAEIPAKATVLEIGAGIGSLTRWLVEVASRVVAVELDAALIVLLQDVMHSNPNVKIVQGDILQQKISELVNNDDYLVVANIPYYITAVLIRFLLESEYKPLRLVLTVQKEVADRICAQPGEMSLLALSVQVYGAPRTMLRIPSGAFYPVPKVDSATVRVDLYSTPLIRPDQLQYFFELARAGFSQKRKMLKNSLSAGLKMPTVKVEEVMEVAELDPHRRAETLSMDDWVRLTNVYSKRKNLSG